MKNLANILSLVFVLFLVNCEYEAAPYAEWAHSHLVWIDAKDQNEKLVLQMVKDYQANGIPVGAVNIDSMWSECINTFNPDRKKFPNMEKIVQNFHEQNIRVILWATPIVNQECPEYKIGKSKDYFLNHGKVVKWWHGHGAFVDFANPEAKKWFTSLMDRVLDMGFDGWKCDGADPLILLLRPWPYSPKLKRYITYRQYANQYYGTFYNYTKTRNPQALIMARPVDSFQGIGYLKYAPKYVMFSGWVGDQHNDVPGFTYAMENIIHSASQGYLSFGFDIGGYKTNGPSQKYLFLRWAQIGALLPFMENGGNGKHQPWEFDQETVQIYRKFVLLHYDLKQFFLSAGTEAYKQKKSILQPIMPDKRTIALQPKGNLGYVLWNAFLVAPTFDANGFTEVVFPAKYNWIYYFNHSRVFKGGVTANLGIKLDEAAFFMRSNSVIPIKKQMWLVHLKEGKHAKTVVAGNYSYDVSINYEKESLSIRVDRYYKNEQVEQELQSIDKITIRVIGVTSSLETIRHHSEVRNVQGEEQQYEFQVTLGEDTLLKGVSFKSQANIITE